MKYAIVNDAKSEAKKGLCGLCPNCEGPMIPKCGEKKIHHWSHKGKLECDPWRENETEWHRNWKGCFHIDNQEVVHRDEITGEKHIADVKTNDGIVIEFQHSPIKSEERKSRNDFYKNIIWIADGKRLIRDETNFAQAYNTGISIGHVKKVRTNKSFLIKDWSNTGVPVFLDFGQTILWLLIPIISDVTTAYIFPISKVEFLEIFKEINSQKKVLFWKFLNDFIIFIKNPNPVRLISLSFPRRDYVSKGPRIDHIQRRYRRSKKRF
jgi:competence protein CoiA